VSGWAPGRSAVTWSAATLLVTTVTFASALPGQAPPPRRGLPVVTDSVRMLPGTPLTFDAFFDQVSRNHPVAM
jgi:hypothetical protein